MEPDLNNNSQPNKTALLTFYAFLLSYHGENIEKPILRPIMLSPSLGLYLNAT